MSEAGTNLRQIARRAHKEKAYFLLEEKGVPVAGVMDAAELKDYLEIHDPEIRQEIAQGYQEYLRGEVTEAREFLAELRVEAAKPRRRK